MPRSNASGARLGLWLALAVLVVVLDQFTKWLILGHYRLGDATHVTGFFNIVRAHNTGAAFSFLAGAGGWQRWFFVALAAAASGFIVWLLRSHPGQKLFAFSLSMILGGAVGNVLDRLMHGYVVDFLDFHWSFLSTSSSVMRRVTHARNTPGNAVAPAPFHTPSSRPVPAAAPLDPPRRAAPHRPAAQG